MRPAGTERLLRLTRAGDLDAARALWSLARRRSDPALAAHAAQALRVLDLHVALAADLWRAARLPETLQALCRELGFHVTPEQRARIDELRRPPRSAARFPLPELLRCLHLASRQRLGLVHRDGRSALAARREEHISLVIEDTTAVRDLLHNATLFVSPEVARAGEPAVLLEATRGLELSEQPALRAERARTSIPHAQLDVVELELQPGPELHQTPRLSTATSLSLRHARLSAAELGGVLDACSEDLRSLDLSHSKRWGRELDPRWLDALCESPVLEHLERLALINVGLRGGHIERLCRGLERAPKLTALALSDNLITAEGARILARSQLTERLAALHISKCGLGEEGLEVLVQAPWPALRNLDLGRNRIGPGVLRLTAGATLFGGLLRVSVDANGLTGGGLEPLVQAERCSLRVLDLSSNRLGPAGASHLADWPQLAELELLDLRKTSLGDDGWERLRSSPFRTGAILGSGDLVAPVGWRALSPPGSL